MGSRAQGQGLDLGKEDDVGDTPDRGGEIDLDLKGGGGGGGKLQQNCKLLVYHYYKDHEMYVDLLKVFCYTDIFGQIIL